MSEKLSPAARRYFEDVISDMKSLSLLHEEEPIITGFYKVLIKGLRLKFQKYAECEGLLTKDKLILIQRKQFSSHAKYELVPYDNIKELILTKVRNPLSLISGLGLIGFTGIMNILFLWRYASSSLLWISLLIFSLGAIVSIIALNSFKKGAEVLFLEIPEERLTMWYIYPHGGLSRKGRITLFNESNGDFEIQTNRAKMEDLYNLLTNYTKCPTMKDDNFYYLFEEKKISENLQAKVHLKNKKSPIE